MEEAVVKLMKQWAVLDEMPNWYGMKEESRISVMQPKEAAALRAAVARAKACGVHVGHADEWHERRQCPARVIEHLGDKGVEL